MYDVHLLRVVDSLMTGAGPRVLSDPRFFVPWCFVTSTTKNLECCQPYLPGTTAPHRTARPHPPPPVSALFRSAFSVKRAEPELVSIQAEPARTSQSAAYAVRLNNNTLNSSIPQSRNSFLVSSFFCSFSQCHAGLCLMGSDGVDRAYLYSRWVSCVVTVPVWEWVSPPGLRLMT